MDESANTPNRRQRRSNVLLAATLVVSGRELPVRMRNLSAEGALVEGDVLPVEGATLLFQKGDLTVAGRIAWSQGRRAGISFSRHLEPEMLMRHIPAPRPRTRPQFKRPGFGARELSAEEKSVGERLGVSNPIMPGDL